MPAEWSLCCRLAKYKRPAWWIASSFLAIPPHPSIHIAPINQPIHQSINRIASISTRLSPVTSQLLLAVT
ncbi:hypothetical protein TWF696_009795 [Orbilia brochopaga]|uniref:Uncharacterized protein n=1 Tax=Orbilia brochopaga TaxID=3140254 RepID=A0AAV9UF69_9PEZI